MTRKFRQLSDETKAKISQSLKGRSKSMTHKEHIRSSMKDYWKTIPNKPINSDSNE